MAKKTSVHSNPSFAEPPPASADDNLADDGDLKFRSKKLLWAPRARRVVQTVNGDAQTIKDGNSDTGVPPTLVTLCLAVLSKNISMVDHVGDIPYALFSGVLQDASADDLIRIEKHNPVCPFGHHSSFRPSFRSFCISGKIAMALLPGFWLSLLASVNWDGKL